jgi:hypothetical protein
MSRTVARAARIPRLSRFGWLMGLYAENHMRLVRLFAPGISRSAPTSPPSATGWTSCWRSWSATPTRWNSD